MVSGSPGAGASAARERRIDRRLVLRGGVAGLAALIAGCESRGHAPPTAAPTSTRGGSAGAATTSAADRDIAMLTEGIAREESVLSFCKATADRFPTQLRPLRAVVAIQLAHVARLRDSLARLDPKVNRAIPPIPKTAADVTAALIALEDGLQRSLTADCQAADAGLLAELFGCLAASHAATVVSLASKTPEPSVSAPNSTDDVDALAPCLAAEHAAVYGYGVLGGVLEAGVADTPLAVAARSSYDAHRERRDAMLELFASAGRQPPAAEPAYRMPFPVEGQPGAIRLAQYLESRCAGVYLRAIAPTTGDSREFASGTLVDCATRGVRWGAQPTAFPGLAGS